MSTLVLTHRDIRELLDMHEIIDAVEKVFIDWTQGKAKMPSKVYVSLEKGDFRAMPATISDGVGIKWVNVHPENYPVGHPTGFVVWRRGAGSACARANVGLWREADQLDGPT